MKTLDEVKQILSAMKPMLAETHDVSEIGVFGSYVRDEQMPGSDVDILVDFGEYPSLLEFVGLEDELTERLGVKVDLVMKTGLKPHVGAHVLREVTYLSLDPWTIMR